jgi:tetratricopeptide (TPR) repeat protein
VYRLAFAALVLLAPASEANPRAEMPSRSGDFWRELVDPHADQIKRILESARQRMSYANGEMYGEVEVGHRIRVYRDVYGMLSYARKLSPENLEVLALLGVAADEIGKTRQALDALHAYLKITGEAKASAEVTGRLGLIAMRMGDLDGAIRYFRLAQAGSPSAQTTVHLANALVVRGQMSEAIDVLANALPASRQYYNNDMTLIAFALAVIYDRDEQRGAAFEVLDKMRTQQAQSFGAQVQIVLSQMRYAPPEDRHYYQALLYEVLDAYTEARAEWAIYAASGDLPWRARALDHIAAIDKLRHATPGPITRIPATSGIRHGAAP